MTHDEIKELLRLAAIAGRVTPVQPLQYCGYQFSDSPMGTSLIIEDSMVGEIAWMPHLDSDDSMDLAITCQLSVDVGTRHRGFVIVRTSDDNWVEFREKWTRDSDGRLDPFVATRLAVLKTAASIGRRKEQGLITMTPWEEFTQHIQGQSAK